MHATPRAAGTTRIFTTFLACMEWLFLCWRLGGLDVSDGSLTPRRICSRAAAKSGTLPASSCAARQAGLLRGVDSLQRRACQRVLHCCSRAQHGDETKVNCSASCTYPLYFWLASSAAPSAAAAAAPTPSPMPMARAPEVLPLGPMGRRCLPLPSSLLGGLMGGGSADDAWSACCLITRCRALNVTQRRPALAEVREQQEQ